VSDAQKKLLFEPAEPELFRWKNLPKWKDSMRTLLPQEFQRWDPLGVRCECGYAH